MTNRFSGINLSSEPNILRMVRKAQQDRIDSLLELHAELESKFGSDSEVVRHVLYKAQDMQRDVGKL